MANANLNLSPELLSCFQKAQEPSSLVRALKLSIQNETITLLNEITTLTENTIENDFNTLLLPLIDENQACFIIFRLTIINTTAKWLLIPFIPDNCIVRHKMLYSSSREDLKKKLGPNLFTTLDYTTSTLNDINYEVYLNSTKTISNKEIMTNKERVLQEEHILTNIERDNLG